MFPQRSDEFPEEAFGCHDTGTVQPGQIIDRRTLLKVVTRNQRHWMAAWGISILLSLSSGCERAQQRTTQSVQEQLSETFQPENAFQIVEYLSDRWRLRGGGNRGYNESLDYVRDFLKNSGFETAGRLHVLEGPLTLQPLAWEVTEASISVVSPEHRQLHTYEDTPTLLAKYSGSTREEGVTAELVDVGAGDQPGDYRNKNVRGKIVLGRSPASDLIEQAVIARGALGVISDRLSEQAYYDRFPDMVQYETVPFGEPEEMKTSGLWLIKISPETGTWLRGLLTRGAVRLNVKTRTRFFDSTNRTLIAEIPGENAPQERIVLVAHLDNNKPGANNNASGIATHAELARTLSHLIQQGNIAWPSRTITFLFGAEREGARQWLDSIGDEAGGIIVMVNADMTGENTELTGGTYRLEKSPEPTMHVERPAEYLAAEDRPSGYRISPIDIDPYPGHFLNDFAWNLIETYAEEMNWPVKRNPFEGWSDHDVFLPLRIPSILSWHWVDYFISTNLDTPDKVSREEMKRVGVAHGMTALTLAAGTGSDALELVRVVEQKALLRLENEAAIAQTVLEDHHDQEGGESFEAVYERQMDIIARWAVWYDEALSSIQEFPVNNPSRQLRSAIESARENLAARKDTVMRKISSHR